MSKNLSDVSFQNIHGNEITIIAENEPSQWTRNEPPVQCYSARYLTVEAAKRLAELNGQIAVIRRNGGSDDAERLYDDAIHNLTTNEENWTTFTRDDSAVSADMTGGDRSTFVCDERRLNATTQQHTFAYDYALNYVDSIMRNVGKHTTDAECTRKAERKTVKQDSRERLTLDGRSKRKTVKARSGSHVKRIDANNVLDVVQSAFVVFMEYGKKTPFKNAIGATAFCCKIALRRWTQENKKWLGKALRRALGESYDLSRDAMTMLREWNAYIQRHDQRLTSYDDKTYDTIAEWLISGASQSDIAKHLGIDKRRISEYVDTLRKQETRDERYDNHYIPQTVRPLTQPELYGQWENVPSSTFTCGQCAEYRPLSEDDYFRARYIAGMTLQTDDMSYGSGI